MDPDLDARLKTLEEKTDRMFKSVEQMRKMYLWTMYVGLALIILPLIGLMFVIPKYLATLDLTSLSP